MRFALFAAALASAAAARPAESASPTDTMLLQNMLLQNAVPNSKKTSAPRAGEVAVDVTGFRNGRGVALIAIYRSKAGFPDDGRRAWRREAVAIADGKASLRFASIPPGRYAVAVLHDENENFEMDQNFLGIPKEGYGVSRNAVGRFGPPKWRDAVFEVAAANRVSLRIRMIYH